MKNNTALWIVTVLLSLVFVAMFIVAMIQTWHFGMIAWVAIGAVDFFLLKVLLKKSADPAKPAKKK
jgi:hypothetical protein